MPADQLTPRRQSFQTVSWFWDQYNRGLLDLDPPYQRRSVWNQSFKDFFVDTILLRYPAPAIFLYEEIAADGAATYHVVDGKQRLITIFEFAGKQFPISDAGSLVALHGKYFDDLPDAIKKQFWTYQFSVEYLPTDDEAIITNVFDRINRNTARLTAQELRHARYSGVFIQSAEEAAEWMTGQLGTPFPNIALQSRRQMKDVEMIAQLLLLLETGPRGYSTIELDEAFAARDASWPERAEIESRFRDAVSVLKKLAAGNDGKILARSRLRNQADFYSLFGAIATIPEGKRPAALGKWQRALLRFVKDVEDEVKRAKSKSLKEYHEAARSASNDSGPRKTRIEILRKVLQAPARKPAS